MNARGPRATPPDVSRAFAAAEAAYLETPEVCPVCEGFGDDCDDECELLRNQDDDWDEHEWEMRQDAKEAREGL